MTTIHYSTRIEENKLLQEEVYNVLKNPNKVISNTGRIRDEKEIKEYYIALDYIEKLIKEKATNSGFLHYDGEGRKCRYFLSEKYENIL